MASEWIDYPSNGYATMTHYTLPAGFIAACGCTTDSSNYPTAAMSQMAYGSSTSYGPGCGRCFNLTLLNTFTSDPPFYPEEKNSVVVKITDLCPVGGNGWCSATANKPNAGGAYINFDLAWPSSSIPADFFPSNVTLYGYTDFGVWNISYQSVDCYEYWAGGKTPAALGSVADEAGSVCCPANPTGNDTCPSYSDAKGLPPDTTTSASKLSAIPAIRLLRSAILVSLLHILI
ncbi:hypothetical protein WOLCODRAFT_138472 [Wolfiporia cocos MD-104 SS10]|uniref:Expansin-like EG45 domain-containing protein n=1 Tax=Wolfiporia cocos (strain MD-104) TaxID=742152 RepID=A0A2H3K3K3_WOLCO|nr:hypothetical protein WOLCODRAFT_138472 [Wolfiporia cocos MD-104 SS10]